MMIIIMLGNNDDDNNNDGRKITHIFWSKMPIPQPVLNIMS